MRLLFFFSSRRRHTRCSRDWSSDVCSSDLPHSLRWRVLLARPATEHRAGQDGHTGHGTCGSCSSWPPGRVCAGVVVMGRAGVVGPSGHAPSLTSPPDMVEAGALPSGAVLLSASSTVRFSPPTSHAVSPRTSHSRAYTGSLEGCGLSTTGDLPCCAASFPD